MKIIFLGTSSNAGKTVMTAAFCRYLSKKGLSVSPFKGSNLSLNSYVTENGKEIGMGQAFQAWASSIEPTEDMNPVLLKPSEDGRIQVILKGVPYTDATSKNRPDNSLLKRTARECFERLEDSFDAVICEGSGSPAEINLKSTEIANMHMAVSEKIPAILVADIERGGSFAAIYGTWLLMDEEERGFLKGFIINRFRGDASILKTGIEKIESLTGMKCIGVVPYAYLKFPEEDCMSSKNGKISGEDIKKAYINNLDELIEMSKDTLDFAELERISSNVIP